ncbi:hypothetical protein NLM27_12990 [Bradyrhizobium sp. CCGB12]|uniref:hypothetical protein n=1 Tax=Bradyrhizobium sp. CCGB12 TaxID=2949632 RepID=UPI0020B439EF|nr:hypothetical protein [Bradyrhizobium sp. CCGB12]MCP3389690.1 hypothetical protein [Bradyrhizobium sp. CCGB12]
MTQQVHREADHDTAKPEDRRHDFDDVFQPQELHDGTPCDAQEHIHDRAEQGLEHGNWSHGSSARFNRHTPLKKLIATGSRSKATSVGRIDRADHGATVAQVTISGIKKQLAALRAIVKPAQSLAARIDRLTDEQRDGYVRWEAQYQRWFERCKTHIDDYEADARPYACTIERDTSPTLRRDVRSALYGPDQRIPAKATEDEAARLYLDYLHS